MKTFVAMFFAFQMLLNCTLAFAHMASDFLDPHDAVQAHAGSVLDDEATGSDADLEDGPHCHLCAVALNTDSASAPIALHSATTPFAQQRANSGTSPPVRPPNT